MQNIGAPKSLDTNLNTASSEVELRSEQPLLRKALSDNFCKSLDEDEEQLDGIVELTNKTTVVVEEQQSPKSKTRSRFSSAFRSFRASSKSSKKNKTLPSSSDQVLSSGGEDLELPQLDTIDTTKKKKSKLSKKFSLAGIKKNKVNPKKEDEITSSNLLLVTSSTQTTQTLDRRPLFVAADNESKRKVTVTSPDPSTPPYSLSPESSPTKFDKVRKIQITIQGKKIEHTNKNTNNSSNSQQWRKNLPTTTTEIIGTSVAPSPSPHTDEGDYLTAITTEEPRQQQQQQQQLQQKPVVTTPFRKNSKRNKKPRSKPNSPPTSPSASPSGNKSITSTISTTTTTEEKFVVTQSICDTPPRERAPAKPSRVAAGLTPSSITTLSPSTASVAAPTGGIRKSLSHQIPKLKRQRSHVIDSSESESYFMIREGTVERGRRFPRPASIENNDLSPLLIAQSQSLPAPLGIPAEANLQLPPPSPPRPTTTAEADVKVKSLPPSVEETNQEPHETINQQQRKIISLPSLASTSSIHSTFEIDNLATDTDITATTTTIIPTNSSYYFSGNNIQNPNLSGIIKDHSFEDTNDSGSLEETPIICEHQHNIRFAVGNPVRPLRTIPLSQIDSKDFSSFGSDKSFGSDQSPTSESSLHRRRIRYVNQPTIYTDEERDILDGKREALNYLSGISEYSFDSEFSVSEPPQMPAFGDLTMDQEDPPIMTSSQEKREHLYKILVIGELGTGKTSFIKRYVHQFFSQNYRATIGVDFALKVLHWDSNTIVRLQLWDIAGQERFGNMTRVYYKEAVGAFIVFDVTRSGTFDCVSKWKEDLDSKVQLPDGSPIPCILLANKCDQDKQGIITTPEKMDEYVRENGFAGWFETSAKENVNIDEAARALVNKILLNDKLISDADIADSEKFNLANSNGGQTTTQAIKSKCSC